MDAKVNETRDSWNFIFTDLADPRTNNWPLISSPVPGMTILITYLYFVLSWGPKYMANRKPFQLEKTLIIYNFIQVLVSMYIVYEGLASAWWANYNWRCHPVDFSYNPTAMRVARICYIYFLAKISELLDTVFFVLRKRDRQITFLHLYHHTVMPMISWGCTKYYPGGHGTFIGLINSFVHIIMYMYYMLSAMGPSLQKYLWWKKHITNLQMAQFCIAFLHSSQLLYTDCGYPRWTVVFTLPNAVFFYFLFNNFYKQSYAGRKQKEIETIKNDECSKTLHNNNNNIEDDDNNNLKKSTMENNHISNGNIPNGTHKRK